MQVEFKKAYGNHTGRRFYQFTVSDDEGKRHRTFDIIYRADHKGFELMSKKQAKVRAELIFSMGDELEGMIQQVVKRFQQYGEQELFRCFQITVSAGIYPRWIEWLVDSKDPLASEPGSPEWRFTEFVKREAKFWM